MLKILGLFFCCALAFASDLQISEDSVIHAPIGSFRGSRSTSQFGKKIYSFRGIRYAEAPTGHNRFKPSTIVGSHEGTFDATQHGPLCPQPVTDDKIISEDCLHLNIFTTALPRDPTHNSTHAQRYRPVLVFSHPGDFITGESYGCGPEVMLIRDIIVVTVNYRLGALGFLSAGDSRAPGNAGLKDQVLALKWVQQNIRAFGGDPNSVTLGGIEAGAWSVSLHIASPLSRGLFHRAFIISGAAPLNKPLPVDQLDLAKRQAQVLGCPIDTFDNMFNCFYTKTPAEFGNSITKLTNVNLYSYPLFTPVIEPGHVDGAFLTAQPIDVIRQGHANFVPFCTGFDQINFNNIADPKSVNMEAMGEFNRKWTELAPKRFGYESDTRAISISNKLRDFYLNGQSLSLENYPKLGELHYDALTVFPIHRFERLMATYSPQPIFNYYNIYKSCDSYPKWSDGTDFSFPQNDELLLLFNVDGHPNHCASDAIAVHHITSLIENFMVDGTPIPKSKSHLYPITWKPSTATAPCYMEYGEDMRFINGVILPERMNKWDELFPINPIQH